jgi:hypothetical protein
MQDGGYGLLRISLLKLSKKSPSGVSSVEIAGIPQRNKPSVPTSWASNAFVTELVRLFRQFLWEVRK